VVCTFINEKGVAIHGIKYHDLNANGDRDDGEETLSGWTIFNDTNNNGDLDAGEFNTTTDDQGRYWFDNIPMGNYKICEEIKSGWIQSEPANPECYNLSLNPGDNSTNKDFGNYVNGSLHLAAFDDLNADGIWQNQTEPLWNGTFIQKKIDLFNSTDGTFITSEFINATGEAWFVDLIPGNYSLQEDIGIFNLTQVMPSPDPDGEGGIPGGADMRNFTITSGQEYAWTSGAAMISDGSNKTEIVVKNQTLSFGNFIKGSLHLMAFDDLNADGIFENGTEPLWNGTFIAKKIDLSYANGTPITSEFIDEFGEAWFVNLMPGNYTLQEDTSIFNLTQVMPSPDPDGEGGIPGGADARNFTITSGQELAWKPGAAMLGDNSNKTEVVVENQTLSFGNFIKGSLHVLAFEDKDIDGNYTDADDVWDGTLIPKTIFLNHTNGTLVDSMVVNEVGEAWFLDLMPGNYTIQEDINSLPSDVGPTPVLPAGAGIRNVTILSGQLPTLQLTKTLECTEDYSTLQ
jgi:hypothetical protein